MSREGRGIGSVFVPKVARELEGDEVDVIHCEKEGEGGVFGVCEVREVRGRRGMEGFRHKEGEIRGMRIGVEGNVKDGADCLVDGKVFWRGGGRGKS